MEKADDEMDVSDEEETSKKKPRQEVNNQEEYFREENNNLRMQMEAYKNEVIELLLFSLFNNFNCGLSQFFQKDLWPRSTCLNLIYPYVLLPTTITFRQFNGTYPVTKLVVSSGHSGPELSSNPFATYRSKRRPSLGTWGLAGVDRPFKFFFD